MISTRKASGCALASFALIAASAQFAASQQRYSVTDEDAMGPGSPRVVVLHDRTAGAEAAIAPSEGGELSSFKVTRNGQMVELIYNARNYASPPGAFHGRGPLLWPAVGAQYPVGTIPKASCGMGTYPVMGKTYPMPCHGFAKEMPWKEISRSADAHGAHVTVELQDSDATRKYYPFAFRLDVNYELADGHLTVDYVVKSDQSNAEPMPFSIGNHLGFNIPFVKGSNPDDVKFETQNTVQLLRNSAGVLSGESKPRTFDPPEALGTFDAHVALPLAGYRSQPFARLIDPTGMVIRVTETSTSTLPEPLIRFNAYGGPKQGYFCPEPWFGVQNSLNTGVGLIKLQPGGSWTFRLLIEVEAPNTQTPQAGTGVERFGGNFAFVEGPVWVTKDGGYLLFSDIYNSETMKMSQPNQPSVYRRFTNAGNGNTMDAQGRLYTAERDGHRISRMEPNGDVSIVAAKYEGKRFNSPNDVVVRKDGNVYFSDPASAAVLEKRELDFNGVYHVSPDGKVSLVAKMTRPNGVALTPDGKTLYVADTSDRKIMAYDLDAAGNTTNERVFISDISGSPDGLRVAANGNVYIAAGPILVYTPNGKLIKSISFPEMAANCEFGGPELKTLFVTARTSVYSVSVPDKGWTIH
ncbi:MAG TPA: SMP-30/gluconolactonase/LRE family protein [Terracidiphilus sp.]|jgi:gluconolactonase|nr:SMP-30/gluconolactonase/LRE family protein [Terracidiphilus sp.]